MFVDAIVIIFVTVPIIYPTIIAYGIDPIQFGVFITCACVVGGSTPPVALNVFNASAIFHVPVEEVFRWIMPFISSEIVVLVMVAYIPALSLWLPRMGGLM